mgnify:CR=1 FL=1
MAGLLYNPSFRFEDLGTSFSRTQQPFAGKYADWSATITRSPYIIPPESSRVGFWIIQRRFPAITPSTLRVASWTDQFPKHTNRMITIGYADADLCMITSMFDANYFLQKLSLYQPKVEGCCEGILQRLNFLYHISETVIDKNWADSFLLHICQYHIYFYKSDIVVVSHSPIKISLVPSSLGWRSMVDLSENWISYL